MDPSDSFGLCRPCGPSGSPFVSGTTLAKERWAPARLVKNQSSRPHLSPMAVHAPPMAIRKADCRLSHLLKYEVDVNIISMDYSLHAYFERSKRCGLETIEGSGQADFLSPSTPLSANTKRTPSTLRAQSSQLRYSPVRPSLDC